MATRRQFLTVGLGCLTATLLPPWASAVAAGSKTRTPARITAEQEQRIARVVAADGVIVLR